MKYLLIIWFWILGLASVYGQKIKYYDLEIQAKHAEIKGYDPSFRINYFENIILKTELTSDVANLQFISGRTGEVLDLKPAAQYQLGYSFDYKWVALSLYYTPKFLLDTQNNPDLEESNSLFTNLNFFYTDQWRQELSYRYYKGFYSDFGTAATGNEPGLLTNTTLETFEGSTFFIANPNFSFRAHYAQTERQLLSAGSLIPKIRYAYSVIKPNFQNITTPNELRQINSIDVLAQVGYLYTFVYDQKWFATAGLHPGIGYNYSAHQYDHGSPIKDIFNSFTLAMNTEIAMGYNSYRWFFGGNLKWRNYNYTNNQEDQFGRDAFYFSVHLGYRLNDNLPMRKFFGWFEDHLGF